MKKYIIGLFAAAFLFALGLPQQVQAAQEERIEIVQEDFDELSGTVKLTLPNAAAEEISSLQISLTVMDKGLDAEFQFDSVLAGTAKVCEARYNEATGKMNLYIAGTKPLYTGSSTLVVGKLVLTGTENSRVTVRAGDVRIVRGTQTETLETESEKELYINDSSVPPSTDPDRLDSPSIAKLVNLTSGIRIRWKQVPDAAGYHIYRKKTANGSWKKIASVESGKATISYVDKSVTSKKDRKYFYTVQAYSGETTSSYDQNGVMIMRLSAPVQADPVIKTNRNIKVKWNLIKKADGYKVQYSTSSNFKTAWVVENVRSGKKHSKIIKGLNRKTVYYIRIRSYRKMGGKTYQSDWSNVKMIETK